MAPGGVSKARKNRAVLAAARAKAQRQRESGDNEQPKASDPASGHSAHPPTKGMRLGPTNDNGIPQHVDLPPLPSTQWPVEAPDHVLENSYALYAAEMDILIDNALLSDVNYLVVFRSGSELREFVGRHFAQPLPRTSELPTRADFLPLRGIFVAFLHKDKRFLLVREDSLHASMQAASRGTDVNRVQTVLGIRGSSERESKAKEFHLPPFPKGNWIPDTGFYTEMVLSVDVPRTPEESRVPPQLPATHESIISGDCFAVINSADVISVDQLKILWGQITVDYWAIHANPDNAEYGSSEDESSISDIGIDDIENDLEADDDDKDWGSSEPIHESTPFLHRNVTVAIDFEGTREMKSFLQKMHLPLSEEDIDRLLQIRFAVASRGGRLRLSQWTFVACFPHKPLIVPRPGSEPEESSNSRSQKKHMTPEERLAALKNLDGKKMVRMFLLLMAAIIGFVLLFAFVVSKFCPQLFNFSFVNDSAETPDFYSVLGLEKSATDEQIRKRYRKLALKWHPDRNPNCAECTAKFAAIAEAYKVLVDPERREHFDNFGTDVSPEEKHRQEQGETFAEPPVRPWRKVF